MNFFQYPYIWIDKLMCRKKDSILFDLFTFQTNLSDPKSFPIFLLPNFNYQVYD